VKGALSFLTPFGRAGPVSPASLRWFPPVGALIGLSVGATWWLAAKAWAPPTAAAIAVAADVAFTGYLHLDGLADSADGLIPPLPRSRRLEVMSDPATGAFGIVTVVLVLLLRFAAFASMAPSPLTVGALWCESRTAMALVARRGRYARPGGLASAFIEPQQISEDEHERPEASPANGRRAGEGAMDVALILGALLAVLLSFAGNSIHGLAAVAGGLFGFGAVILFARRRIGGFTGDVLGAAGVVGETAGLLVLCARW
jgi:adenosylcobinamide-GDP ribazoletransferase